MNQAVAMFQGFQRICGICPCCGEVFRLSDATLYYRAQPPRTPWDDLRQAEHVVQRAEDRLDNERQALRMKAKEAGWREMRKRLRSLTAFYRTQRIELEDLKLIFDPVDYVAFRGMSQERCSAVEFIDCQPTNRKQERLQTSLQKTLKSGNYSWITMRLTDDGRVQCS